MNDDAITVNVDFKSFLKKNGALNPRLLQIFCNLTENPRETRAAIVRKWLDGVSLEELCRCYQSPPSNLFEFDSLLARKLSLEKKLGTHECVTFICDIMEEVYIREHAGKKPACYPTVSKFAEELRAKGVIPKKASYEKV